MLWPNSKPALSLSLLALLCLAAPAQADTLSFSLGSGVVNALSADYRAQSSSEINMQLRYTHELIGHWSIAAVYAGIGSPSFSGYAAGVVYDFLGVRSAADTTGTEGIQVSNVPKWALRSSVFAGSWRYIDTLTIERPRPGEKPLATVEAQLYGMMVGVSLQRFINNSFAVGVEVQQAYTTSQNFSVSSTVMSLSTSYFY